MKRLKVLISAYACEPNKGSEPSVGWNVALEMSKYHDVWVLTRANNRGAIQEWLALNPLAQVTFLYYDIPRSILRLKRGLTGVQIYYYLWQIAAYFVVRRNHARIGFDLIHHVTFVKYWAPSLLCLLPVPFLWGPLGGGESTPPAFLQQFSTYGKIYEKLRSMARWLGERDPLVQLTVRRSSLAIATTKETATRLENLGATRIEILNQCAISKEALSYLSREPLTQDHRIIFISAGNFLPLKGFHLGLAAFSKAQLKNAEFWMIGDGPERLRLTTLTQSLGIQDRVHFLGRMSLGKTLETLKRCTVLVHPSLHESGGFVCIEAMAAGKPVICLDQGGPGVLVTSESGIKARPGNPDQVIEDIAIAMTRLAADRSLREKLGRKGQELVRLQYTWEQKGVLLSKLYNRVLSANERSARNVKSINATASIR